MDSYDKEIDNYWPKSHAIDYYSRLVVGLEKRVEELKTKIKKLKEQDGQT